MKGAAFELDLARIKCFWKQQSDCGEAEMGSL